jgi:hypothetical protein
MTFIRDEQKGKYYLMPLGFPPEQNILTKRNFVETNIEIEIYVATMFAKFH